MEPTVSAKHPINEPAITARRRQPREVVVVFLLAISIIASSFIPFAQPTKAVSVSEETVIAYTNRERVTRGLSPLRYDAALAQAAAAKAKDMIDQNYFAHYFKEQTPWDFIIQSGDNDWQYAGENLAKNYTDTSQLVTDWMASPPHRANILNDHFDRIGVSVVLITVSSGEQITLTVQMFTGA